jgi:RNA polymerase sigma factor (TIGR02999 family)
VESNSNITGLLWRWREGGRETDDALARELYPLLHDIARALVRRNPAFTLSTTELLHETYLRIAGQREVRWRNRGHFLSVAATVARRVVVDYLRERSAQKRGAGAAAVDIGELSAEEVPQVNDQLDWIGLDQALTRLQELDPDAAHVVELRLFAGLEVDEVAEVRGCSPSTIARQWRFARAWLAEQLDVRPDA